MSQRTTQLIVAILVSGIIVTAISTDAAAQVKHGLAVADAFDGTMKSWMAKYGIARGSLAVMRNERLVFAAGYGGQSASERIPIWSMSKAITGACLATLVQDKKLRFDDPIGPILAPAIARYGQPLDERLNRVTIAQLLSHRGGLPEEVGDNRFAPGAVQLLEQRPLSDATVDMLMPAIMKLTLAATPGSKYAYSNIGYLLLGQIIESVTGESYESVCGRRVLAAAGIKNPRLDEKWGRLLHSAAGWALSGPEFLAFARIYSLKNKAPLTRATHNWLRVADNKWTDDDRVFAYTLGVRLHVFTNALPNIFHGGAWVWHGQYAERRGTWFVLRNDGVAWFASFDGVTSFSDSKIVAELQEGLWRAARSASSWPLHDLFVSMGIGPVSPQQ
jgi:CubicO group peptidase (beta-lactamase class C family)